MSDIEAARAELVGRGVDVSEVFHRTAVGGPPVSGRHPEGRSYASFATFKDPDGNSWLLQEITARLPGRVDANETKFTSPSELAAALRRAGAAHGEHEKRTGGQYRRELAGLVRRIHGRGAGRQTAAHLASGFPVLCADRPEPSCRPRARQF